MSDKKPILLSAFERKTSASLGSLFLVLSLVLLIWPPNYHTKTAEDITGYKTTSVETPPEKWTCIAAVAGLALIFYAINGLKIVSFTGAGISADTRSEAGAETGEIPVQSAAVTAVAQNQPNLDFALFMHRYLNITSWINLKVLLICKLSSDRGQLFNLRSICDYQGNMSYDYSVACLMSAAALGMFTFGTYNLETTDYQTGNFAPFIGQELDREMAVRIARQPAFGDEVQKIRRYFGVA
jgi:hypothetical protein